MKLFGILIFITNFTNYLFSQNNYIATIGNDTITNETIEAIQFFYPEFHLVSDTTELKNLLSKYYQVNLKNSNDFDTTNQINIDNFNKKWNIYSKLLKIKLLSNITSKTNIDSYNVTNKEIETYYTENINNFIEPASITYMRIWLSDTSLKSKNKMNELVNYYTKQSDSILQFTKISKDDFSISFEVNVKLNATASEEKYLKNAIINKEVFITYDKYSGYSYLCLLKEIKNKPKPFEVVKSDIVNIILSQKQATKQNKINRELNEKYPIILNKSYE